jgi:hypothetical protein
MPQPQRDGNQQAGVVDLEPTPMDFPTAMRAVLKGQKITRLAWNQPRVVISLTDGFLHILQTDGILYRLSVSEGDMVADDWMVV